MAAKRISAGLGRNGERVGSAMPLALAILAWAVPIAAVLWAAVHFGFESRTAGFPDEVWFGALGTIPGVAAAGGCLILLKTRRKAGLPVVMGSLTKQLAVGHLVLFVTAFAFFAVMVANAL